MDQKSFNSLDQGIHEDLPLTPVTTTDSNYSCCPITNEIFDYDSNLFQNYSQNRAFNVSLLPLSTLQSLSQSWPSASPVPLAYSTDSYSLNTQHEGLTPAASDYDSSLFVESSQPQALKVSPQPLSSPQRLAQSRPSTNPIPFTDKPTMSKRTTNRPLLPSGLINPPIYTSIHSAATTDISTASKLSSPHTAHMNGPLSGSENRISRRRAQNCASQRAFRARKEKMIMESSQHLEILKAELGRLMDDNGSLSNTVDGLRGEIKGLRLEQGALRRANVVEHELSV